MRFLFSGSHVRSRCCIRPAGFAGVLCLAFPFFCPPPAEAQVQVVGQLSNDRNLQCEDIPVLMTIQNQTPWPVSFGKDGNAEITFRIERRPGQALSGSDEPVPVDPYTILAGRTATLEVEISRIYDISRTGPYTMWPRVVHKKQTYRGRRMVMDIVPGLDVLTKKILFRQDDGVEKRSVSVRTISRENAQFAFLRVTNENGNLCYGLHELGRYLSTEKPIILGDSSGFIHVLHLSRPQRYTYGIHEVGGAALERKFYTKQSSNASLQYNDEGDVLVLGVARYEGDTTIQRPKAHRFNPFEP